MGSRNHHIRDESQMPSMGWNDPVGGCMVCVHKLLASTTKVDVRKCLSLIYSHHIILTSVHSHALPTVSWWPVWEGGNESTGLWDEYAMFKLAADGPLGKSFPDVTITLSADTEDRAASKLCCWWRIIWCSASVKTRYGFEVGEPSFSLCGQEKQKLDQ